MKVATIKLNCQQKHCGECIYLEGYLEYKVCKIFKPEQVLNITPKKQKQIRHSECRRATNNID